MFKRKTIMRCTVVKRENSSRFRTKGKGRHHQITLCNVLSQKCIDTMVESNRTLITQFMRINESSVVPRHGANRGK
uniref:50S ribosomal protein L18 n=1 Tax=Panagrellus redivivus TaxID=6233 RepID=A0A7E4UNZ5_PANRE